MKKQEIRDLLTKVEDLDILESFLKRIDQGQESPVLAFASLSRSTQLEVYGAIKKLRDSLNSEIDSR